MHETVFAKKIIEEAERHGTVTEINLEIGELAPVPTEELVDCIKGIVTWKVNYKETPSKVECECGYEGRPTILERGHDYFYIECPKCHEIPNILEGQDIKIVSVKVK